MKEVRKALVKDYEALSSFLGQAGVRNDGIENGTFYLLEEDGLQGAIGVEKVDSAVLFRSFVIADTVDKWHFYDFFLSVITCVKKEGVDKLYVITNNKTSFSFFELFGFTQIEKEQISPEIEELSHYQYAISQQEATILYTCLPTC
ncbi:MAG: hypothetical protein ACI35O_16595 [Bacillaceae bacterium]